MRNLTNIFVHSVTSTEHKSMDLAIFHDSRYAYIEYRYELMALGDHPDLATYRGYYAPTSLSEHVEKFVDAIKEAYTADRHPTNPIPVIFQSSFAQRSSIKFKTLVRVDDPVGR